MDITSRSLSHGVGGNYTRWQRPPPRHRVYQVETPEGTTVVTVYAENRAIDDEPHATVQLIETATDFKSEVNWDELSDETRDAVRTHFDAEVKDDDWFTSD